MLLKGGGVATPSTPPLDPPLLNSVKRTEHEDAGIQLYS